MAAATTTTTEKTRTTASDPYGMMNPWWGKENFGLEVASQIFRDLAGLQLRAARTMLEHNVAYSRKLADHVNQQLEEGSKLSQDTIKYGLNIMEDFRKVLFESAEKSFKTEGHS